MSKLIDLKINQEKGIAIMTFYQYTFDQNLVRQINDELDQLEKLEGPLCLITTCSNKKIYSAGLNFKVFKQNYEDVHNFIAEYCRLLARFMKLGFPTIACINGHCLAGGFMFAMCHDLRLINSNQNVKLGMTEINLGMTIPQAMIAPLEAKMNSISLRQICLFGETVNPQQCLKWNVVDELVNKDQLLERCKQVGEKLSILGENRIAYQGIKMTLYNKYIQKAEQAYPDPISKKLITYLATKL